MGTYAIEFRFGPGGGWQARCDEGSEISAHARTLAAGRAGMRRALAKAHGCREDEVVLDETVALPPGLTEVLEQVRTLRRRADEERRRSVEATRQAVNRLAQAAPTMGMRDIAMLVGVSYQRVQQLLSHPGPVR